MPYGEETNNDWSTYFNDWQQQNQLNLENNQFNPDFQGTFNQAMQDYDPNSGVSFQDFYQNQLPTQGSQYFSAGATDFANLLNAQNIEQDFYFQGLQKLSDLQAEYPDLLEGIMNKFSSGMEGVQKSQRSAMDDYTSGTNEALEQMLSQIAGLSEQRGETSDELRGLGEQAMEMGEDTRDRMNRRGDQRDRKLDRQLSAAGSRARGLSDKAQATAAEHTAKLEAANAAFQSDGLAFMQAQTAGINANNQSNRDSIMMMGLPPEQEAALLQNANQESASQAQGMVAQTSDRYQENRFKADVVAAGGLKVEAEIATNLAGIIGNVDSNIAQLQVSAAGIAADFDVKTEQISTGMMMDGLNKQVQASMLDYQGMMQESGMMMEITKFEFAKEESRKQWTQYMGNMAAATENSLANMAMQGLSQYYSGEVNYAQMLAGAGALFNPISMQDLMSSQLEYTMAMMSAGMDPNAYGTAYGGMVSGEHPGGSQNYGGQVPQDWLNQFDVPS